MRAEWRGDVLRIACVVVAFSACLPNGLRSQLVPISAEAHAEAAKRHVNAAINGSTSHGVLDVMLRIESAAPGFAGYFVDNDTVLTALLVNSENEGRLRAAIEELKQRREPKRFNSLTLTKVTRIAPALYSLSELMAWQDAIWRAIAAFDLVSAVGVDITQNKVRIGITHAGGEPVALDAVRKLGVPSDAVRVVVIGRIYTL